MYDLNKSGTITKDEFTEILKVNHIFNLNFEFNQSINLSIYYFFLTKFIENDWRQCESTKGRQHCRTYNA